MFAAACTMLGVRGRLGLIVHYTNRASLYNLTISLLGGAALYAISLATGDETLTLIEHAGRALRIATLLVPILVVSGGYLISSLAMRLFHYREQPFYFNRGLGPARLALASWVAALISASILLGARQLWL